jgi:prepilin-type N-terminal cleavage/methylation domain-containing protein
MTKRVRFSGFTLIELLIVIGLLAALASVLLPSLMGSREDALAGIDKYNAAGTLRVLRQFETFTDGKVPNGMHTGLNTAGTAVISGATAAYKTNAANAGSIAPLTDEDITALKGIGITKLAYGSGNPEGTDPDEIVGYKTIAIGDNVVTVTTDWKDEDGSPITFNGKTIGALNTEGYVKVINLSLAPTTDWSASESQGWVKGFKVGIDVPGVCPVVDDEFAYYTVFIGITDGVAGYSTNPTNTTGTVPTAPAPASPTAATIGDLKTAINTAISTAGTEWTPSTWIDDDDGISSVLTVAYTDGGTNVGTVAYTITYSDVPTAKLLGTSCPEHGVTNP